MPHAVNLNEIGIAEKDESDEAEISDRPAVDEAENDEPLRQSGHAQGTPP
jgi:hypothetical protein